jgi:outer membrane protein assembly factor BamB
MRATFILLLCASLAACRTSNLGACAADADCSAGAACDVAQRVCVATEAPRVSDIALAPPAGYTNPDGLAFFDTSGAPLSVVASISGTAGVDAASVCLRVAGESGACAHPGTAASGSTFTFSLPRVPASADGRTPLEFTVAAASPTGRTATSAVQRVYFDGQPPAISVAADSTPYARTLPDGGAAPISVSVIIADGSGVVSPQLLSGTAVLAPASSSGNFYVFQLDPRDAPAGTEGAHTFHVRALDPLGHEAGADATRTIDDAPPAVTMRIYKDVPDAGGVTYPAATPNTGWTGATFVYSDTVHVQGTITDLTGVGSATFHLDGIDLDGGVSLGTGRPLGCTPGSIACPFSLDVTLNDAGSEFHTRASTFDAGANAGLIPAGMLQFTIEVQDTAAAFGGTQSAHGAFSGTSARTTRLLWQSTASGSAVSGFAVHPNGDVIVTMDGGTGNTVYALAPDQPLTRWGVTLNATPPARGVTGTPAIGAGDATSARIYVASSIGDFYAINPDGGEAWRQITSSNSFRVGPAVTQVTTNAGTVDQVIEPDGRGGTNAMLWRATSAADVTSVPSSDRDFHAAPLILDGGVYFAIQNSDGTGSHLTKHSIAPDGRLGAAAPSVTDGGAPYFGLVTDGTNLYAATRPSSDAGILVGMDTSFNPLPLWTSSALSPGLAGEPTLGIDGKLYGANLASNVLTLDAATGAATPFLTLDSVGLTPLQGSDGHIYIPQRPGRFSAYEGNRLSWTFEPPAAVLRYAIMDCHGRVFVGSGAMVSAFISDDRGLADTPWPSLRRDARNTGNAGALKYGIRTASGCTQ